MNKLATTAKGDFSKERKKEKKAERKENESANQLSQYRTAFNLAKWFYEYDLTSTGVQVSVLWAGSVV